MSLLFAGRLEENGFEVTPGERGGDRGRRGRGRGEWHRKHTHSRALWQV